MSRAAPASEPTLFGDAAADVEALRAEYLRLVRADLPAAADAAWPVRLDHCFMRIVLDHLFGRPWRAALPGRTPAYRQLSAEQLRRAIAIARAMLAGGPEATRRMNATSLRWREAAPPCD